MAEVIKRVIFIIMTVIMIFIFWDVIFCSGIRSILLITVCIIGCLAIGIIDIFIES